MQIKTIYLIRPYQIGEDFSDYGFSGCAQYQQRVWKNRNFTADVGDKLLQTFLGAIWQNLTQYRKGASLWP